MQRGDLRADRDIAISKTKSNERRMRKVQGIQRDQQDKLASKIRFRRESKHHYAGIAGRNMDEKGDGGNLCDFEADGLH